MAAAVTGAAAAPVAGAVSKQASRLLQLLRQQKGQRCWQCWRMWGFHQTTNLQMRRALPKYEGLWLVLDWVDMIAVVRGRVHN